MKIIVAACKNFGIGFQNKLPWNLKKELVYFKNRTMGNGNNIILMGSNTWKSLPKTPLPYRFNCILSSKLNNDYLGDSVNFFKTKEEFTEFVSKKSYDDIWIIGGESIYKQFINEPYIENIYLTDIDEDYECDSFFPKIPVNFKLTETSGINIENNVKYRHKLFSRN